MTRRGGPGGRLFPVDPPRSRRGRARRGLDATVSALRLTKRWTDTDEALTALCRILADEVDAAALDLDESRFVRARVAAAYHQALMSLLQVAAPHDDDGDLDELLAGIFDAPESEPAV